MKNKNSKKEKVPMTPEVKRTWISSVTALICVIMIVAAMNGVGGKICDTIVKAADKITQAANYDYEFTQEDNFAADATITQQQNDGETLSPTAGISESTAADKETGKTTAEIVEIYNSAANKIKATAKSITRNYSKMKSLPEYLQLPSAIDSLGKWAIEKFVKGSDEPAYFTTKDDIVAYFPVSGENYTSHLTADMVKNAAIKDNGKTYDITIVLHNDKLTSPKKGTVYAGVFNTVSASTFEDINIPGTTFESVKINGINGKINCTVDKATRNITKIIFANTDVLNLGVKVAGSNLDVKFALECENSYSVNY